MSLALVTIASRAVELNYPIIPVIESALPVVDEVIVNIDIGPGRSTWDHLFAWVQNREASRSTIQLVSETWDWTSKSGGVELARQTNKMFGLCRSDWILYLQADEILHEEDYEDIRWITTLPEDYAGAEFVRLYFWRDLKTLRTDWTYPLVRMIRRGRGRSVGDAMNCETDGLVWPGDPDGRPRIFHYTRTGTPEAIGKRIRNLDTLFHSEDELDPMQPYDFVLRAVDGHLKGRNARLPEIDPSLVLSRYRGTHPCVMRSWFTEHGIT